MKDTEQTTKQFLGAEELLNEVFHPSNRPSVYWLRDQRQARKIPYIKIGRKILYDAEQVRGALRDRFTVDPGK